VLRDQLVLKDLLVLKVLLVRKVFKEQMEQEVLVRKVPKALQDQVDREFQTSQCHLILILL
jgi:hypothetical protein